MAWLRERDHGLIDCLPTDLLPGLVDGEWIGFSDHWKMDVFRPYRPLVLFVALGSDLQFRLLELSLLSLLVFGVYDEDVLVATDRDDVLSIVPPAMRERTHIWKIAHCKDVLDYCCARYRIAEWSNVGMYNPILYVDTDVIFDVPLDPILRKMAFGRKLFAQGSKSELLRTSSGVGADLFRAAGVDPGETRGVCTGIIGIPMPLTQVKVLNSIGHSVYRLALSQNTRVPGWYDQPAANYVLFSLDAVESELLHKTVRWGGRNALHNGLERKGFIHLWGGNKEDEMRDILNILSGKPRSSQDPWIVYDLQHARHETDFKALLSPMD